MASKVPLVKPSIGDEEILAAERVMRSGLITQGPEVEVFEEEFKSQMEGLNCIAVNSGTSALVVGLAASGVGPGDEVIVPSFTFAATANAVALTGAVPVFADIDPKTFCISTDSVQSLIGPKTTGIMPVHLYGHPAEMKELSSIALKNGLLLFEDSAQAHFAEFDGQKVGTFGLFSAFSFYATKNMTTGEGGMIVTRDSSLAEKARLLRNQGMITAHNNEIVGFNNRMTDIAAAIGRVQLRKLEEMTKRREEIASEFNDRLSGVTIPFKSERVRHVYHQYTVRVENRDEVMSRLEKKAIKTGIYYRTPVHRLPSFLHKCSLPQTDLASEEVLSIPVFPSLAQSEIDRIVEGVNG